MSSGFLLDTSILSLSAPGRQPIPPELVDTLGLGPENTYVSVVAMMEIQQGADKLRRRPETDQRGRIIEKWLEDTIERFGDRVLPLDLACAREAGRVSDAAFARGVHPGFADVAIAATAKVHDLTVVTRNAKHFVPLEAPCIDPFDAR